MGDSAATGNSAAVGDSAAAGNSAAAVHPQATQGEKRDDDSKDNSSDNQTTY